LANPGYLAFVSLKTGGNFLDPKTAVLQRRFCAEEFQNLEVSD
jgi:hypothetical protein